MGFAITEKQEVWKYVGDRDFKLHDYDSGFVWEDIAFLWNEKKVDGKIKTKIIEEIIKVVFPEWNKPMGEKSMESEKELDSV